MKHASLLSILFLFPFCALVGQATQSVTFNILPAKSWVRVDGQVLDLSQQRTTSLKPGTYQIEIWAPEFAVEYLAIVVEPDRPLVVRWGLRTLADEYLSYREEAILYRNDKLRRVVSGAPLVAGNVGLAYMLLVRKRLKAVQVRKDAETARIAHLDAVTDDAIIGLRSQYEGLAEEFLQLKEEHKNTSAIGYPLVALSTAATVYFFHRQAKKRLVKPIYHATNPFAVVWQRSSPQFTLFPNGGNVGFTLNF